MATNPIRLRKYQALIRSLFPKGQAWLNLNEKDSKIRKLLDALGIEACRIEDAALDFIEEVDPRTTTDLLTDWERLLALPDDCESQPENLTVQQRRDRVVQVLTTQGGQNEAFYKQLASNFGIDIDVITVEDQPPFRAGRARAGDRLTNGDWRFTFIIDAPASSAIVFRAGTGRAGDRLRDFSNPTLECLINKHKPAHTIAIFTFGGI
tara:strand:+ start:16750 stop:17373 length:624 start_codon:yes stop_codon:yes gene_type:complete